MNGDLSLNINLLSILASSGVFGWKRPSDLAKSSK